MIKTVEVGAEAEVRVEAEREEDIATLKDQVVHAHHYQDQDLGGGLTPDLLDVRSAQIGHL